jgi:hypothetical protein
MTYGGKMFDGVSSSSYHGVIAAAGLVDAAAEQGVSCWPESLGLKTDERA